MKATRGIPSELAGQYRARGWWRERILWDDAAATAQREPAKVAVVDAEGSYRYGELLDLATAVMGGLHRAGVGVGDVVIVQMPPLREFVPVILAVERLGAVVAPLVPSLAAADIEQVLALAAPRAVVTIDRHRRHRPADLAMDLRSVLGDACPVVVVGEEVPAGALGFRQLAAAGEGFTPGAAPTADALAELAFTSGSTGRPKGVLHTHNTSLSGIRSTLDRQRIDSSDVVHVPLPVGHNYGYFYGVRLALTAGSTLVLQRSWDPRSMLKLLAAHRVTVTSATPTHLNDLLELQRDWDGRLDSVRLLTCAGAPLPADLAARAVELLPGRLSRAFGMTEVGHVTATGPDTPREKLLHTEGRPQPEIEVRLVGDDGHAVAPGRTGELAFRGPFLFAGYHEDPTATAAVMTADGFFRTGDLGHVDGEGYVVIEGRLKDVLIRGGETISLVYMEQALSRHDAVADVGVVGVTDPRLGERPVACVKAAGGEQPSLQELLSFLEQQGVSRLYWPDGVVFLDEIPRNEAGKIVRKLLRTALDGSGIDEGGA